MNQYHSSPDEIDLSEIDRLVAAMERGEITTEEEERLESLVCSNSAARQRYVLGLGLIASLEWEVGSSGKSSTLKAPSIDLGASMLGPAESDSPMLGAPLSDLPPSSLLSAENLPARSWWNWLGPAPLVGFAAWVIAAVALGAWIWFNHHQANQPLAGGNEPAKANPDEINLAQDRPSQPDLAATAYVARIVKASTDCRWGKLTTPVEFLVRVRAGDQLHIAAGLVELEFYSGARVILHGPAVFTPTGIASGHLESGRLTGEVTDGNFRLMTPAAEVIDLGTSFGVAADAAVGTDVVVFDGRVQVVSVAEGRAAEPLDMTEGMAARFRVDGSTEYGLHTDAAQFKRIVAPNSKPTTQDTISLIDIVAGGDGLGTRLAGAIDPLTGRKDYGERVRRDPGSRSKRFHAVTWNPLIDGVFIPTRNGRRVQVDSLGNRVNLPGGSGRTWGPVWARSKESIVEMAGDLNGDFWGDRTLEHVVNQLERSQMGLVGVHSNVGITLDLRAMHLLHRRVPEEFRATVANIENSHDFELKDGRRLSANFHVLVDGELRYERLQFGRDDGPAQFTVPLRPSDRFLTILSTDDGDVHFDHVVLIDPTIVLAKSP